MSWSQIIKTRNSLPPPWLGPSYKAHYPFSAKLLHSEPESDSLRSGSNKSFLSTWHGLYSPVPYKNYTSFFIEHYFCVESFSIKLVLFYFSLILNTMILSPCNMEEKGWWSGSSDRVLAKQETLISNPSTNTKKKKKAR
jgi:hypothetical protein